MENGCKGYMMREVYVCDLINKQNRLQLYEVERVIFKTLT